MVIAPIGVGIIGVNADRGWASTAHIPALRALERYEIRALSTTNQASADAVRGKFDVERSYSDYHQLLDQDDIDLVVVTVKAPNHQELVTAALNAGKSVYCEWPLGVNLDQARAMAALARSQKVRTIIGLQARHAPQVEYARDLIADGYVGDVLSTSMIGLQSVGASVSQANAYMLEEVNGASLLTVSVGHCLDTLSYVLGEFYSLTALTAVRRPIMTVLGTSEQRVKTTADQVGVLGTLKSGALASIHIHEGSAGGTGFLWEVNGSKGTLRITADWALPEIFTLTISGSSGQNAPSELNVPTSYRDESDALAQLVGTPAYNVGRIYASYADDLSDGTRKTAGFEEAVVRHEMIAAISASTNSGTRADFRPERS